MSSIKGVVFLRSGIIPLMTTTAEVKLMNKSEERFVKSMMSQKSFNYKPKKEAIFSFKPIVLEADLKEEEHRNVLYYYLPCKVINIDGKEILTHNHTIQLSSKRDYGGLYMFLKKNELLGQDKFITLKIDLAGPNQYSSYTLLDY